MCYLLLFRGIIPCEISSEWWQALPEDIITSTQRYKFQVLYRVPGIQILYVMMTSSNGNISALLALCDENPPVTSGFLSQRPVTRSFDVFCDLRLNKRLSKQSRRRWFQTPLRSLWRHCGATMRPSNYAHGTHFVVLCFALVTGGM